MALTRMIKSGKLVDVLNIQPDDISILDIAHNLSMICRFTGAFPFHYSVAQHSVLVAAHMEAAEESTAACLAGLLHDGAEYVFNDLSSVYKRDDRFKAYLEMETALSRQILSHFGVDPNLLDLVKPYDEKLYHLETRVIEGLSKDIMSITPQKAYWAFLNHFTRYTRNFT